MIIALTCPSLLKAPCRYEEQSLGIFEEPPDDEDEEPGDLAKYAPRQRIGRYLVRSDLSRRTPQILRKVRLGLAFTTAAFE